MTVVLRLLLRRVRALGKIIRDREGVKVVVMAAFMLLFGAVMLAEFVMFRQGLVEVLRIGPPSVALTLFILESFLILVLVIAVISFVATGLSTFFRSPDTAFLLSTPLSLRQLFWLRATETFVLTSWAFVVLGVPALLALGTAYHRNAAFYLRAAGVLLLFMALAGGMGILLTLLVGAASRRYRTRPGILLATVVLVGGLAFLVARHAIPSEMDFYLIFEPGIPNGKPASLKFIEHRFWLWPTHPLAISLFDSVGVARAGSNALGVLAWILPACALVAAGLLGERLFAATVSTAAEGFGGARQTARRAATPFPRFVRGRVGALVERDLLGVLRTPQELGRVAFIVFLLLLYTSILFVLPLGEILDRPEAVARLFFLDLVALGYFVTAFGIRFVFPSLSLEGRGAWVVFTSPVPPFRLFLGKLLAHTILLLLVVGPIAAAGALRLVSAAPLFAIFALLLVLLTATTVTLSLGFGLLWANFRETNAERLTTNVGGLANIILSLGYVATVGWLGHGAVLAHFAEESVMSYAGGALALSAAIILCALAVAHTRLKQLEIL